VTALCQAVAGLDGSSREVEAALLVLRMWALYHLNELGDSMTQAIAVGEPLLDDAERVLGPDHSITLASRGNLAAAYEDAGRYAEAIGLHERTLADRERLLGPDHPDTLASRNNVALTYQEAGRAAEAIPLFEQTLADMERVLGPTTPRPCNCRATSPPPTRRRARLDNAFVACFPDQDRLACSCRPRPACSRASVGVSIAHGCRAP
jgi:tetratricopeptide (TPR) repeat protein